LWSYVSPKLKIDRRKLRKAIVDTQGRCNRIIWAMRPGALTFWTKLPLYDF
jgi:hypothetical protein